MARSLDSVTRAGQRRDWLPLVGLAFDVFRASLFHIGMRVLGPCLVVMALSLKGRSMNYILHVKLQVRSTALKAL